MYLPLYVPFPELAAADIVLRQVLDDDLPDVLDISFYNARPATSLADAATMLRQINEDYARGECLHWGIADVQTNRIVGTLGFYRGFAEGVGELGCVMKPAFRGRGLMQPAMALVIGFGLGQMGLHNIIALTSAQNTPAIRLLERLQFHLATAGKGDEMHYRLH
jgi:ribosomal-protein-alanine N-acetyltransferase